MSGLILMSAFMKLAAINLLRSSDNNIVVFLEPPVTSFYMSSIITYAIFIVRLPVRPLWWS